MAGAFGENKNTLNQSDPFCENIRLEAVVSLLYYCDLIQFSLRLVWKWKNASAFGS